MPLSSGNGVIVPGGTPIAGPVKPGWYPPPPAPSPSSSPVPAPVEPITTGIDISAISQEVYGKVIPISLGGRRRMGGYIVWGPKITDTPVNGVMKRYASFAVSFGFSAEPDGVRDVLEIRLDTRVAFSLIKSIPSMPGLVFRFYPGTETQEPDPLAVAEFGSAANAFRGQMILFFDNLPLEAFGNKIPFVSALICDRVTSGATVNTFDTPTSSSIRSIGAIDWTGGVMYTHGRETSYRLLAHRLSDRTQLFDIPIVNLSTVFVHLDETCFLFCKEFRVLFATANTSGGSTHVVAIDPDSGAILAESDVTISGAIGPAFSYAIAGTKAVIASTNTTNRRLHLSVYDPAAQSIEVIFDSPNNLDGLTSGSLESVVVAPSGGSVFYVCAGDKLVRATVDVDAGSVALSVVYTASATINNLHGDPTDGRLVVFLSDGTAVKIELSGFTAVWTKTPGFTVPIPGAPANHYGTTEGWRKTRPYFGFYDGTTIKIFDLTNGSVPFSESAVATGGHVMFDTELMVAIITDNGDPREISFTGSSTDAIDKSEALETLAEFFGYTTDEFETVGITGTWIAIIIAYDTNFQDLIRLVADVEGWQVIETGDKLKVVQRALGSSLVVDMALTENDIKVVADAPSVQNQIEEDVELPRALELVFIDPTRDFNWNLASYVFAAEPVAVTASVATKQIKWPVVMSMDQAKLTIAAKAQRDRIARQAVSFHGMPSTMNVEPGDVLTVPTGIATKTIMVNGTDFGSDFSNKISGTVLLSSGPINDDAFWTPGVLPTDPGTVVTPVVPSDGSMIPLFLDTPLLNYDHDVDPTISEMLRVYAAMATRAETMTGGYILVNHPVFDTPMVFASIGAAPLCGAISHVLGTTSLPFQTDRTNTITLNPIFGDWTAITDLTYLELCNETQLFAVGKPGRWEVISVGDVTANSDGTYTLATLLRGLYGTEGFCDDHAAGDYIVRITGRQTDWTSVSDTNIWKRSLWRNLLGETIQFQAVPYSVSNLGEFPVEGYAVHSVTVAGNAEKPWAPCHLDADISGSDIALTWTRRDRLDEGLHDSDGNVPLSEASESYDVEIYDGATLKRTYSAVTAASKTYPAADITADFGSIPASLKFKVYQNSAVIGRGFASEATIQL